MTNNAPDRELTIVASFLSVKHTNLSQSLVSHHLRLLKAARLFRDERRGRSVFYEADDGHVRTMSCDMVAHMREPEGQGK